MKRHSWVLHRSWLSRRCVRCGALLKLAEKVGPRGGTHYSYAEKGQKFGIVARIPECSFRRAGGGPPVSPGAPSSPPEGIPAVGPTERVGEIVSRYEQYAAEWRAKGRAKEAEAMDEIVASLKAGTATDPRTVA